jgi:hypothetical protein
VLYGLNSNSNTLKGVVSDKTPLNLILKLYDFLGPSTENSNNFDWSKDLKTTFLSQLKVKMFDFKDASSHLGPATSIQLFSESQVNLKKIIFLITH